MPLLILLLTVLTSCQSSTQQESHTMSTHSVSHNGALETATFGAGCFWCVEAVFQRLDGVESVASGYSGGHVDKPTYRQVCDGTTGHAEVIQIQFDPSKISYEDLLYVFWRTHDPTTLNRQGNDQGTQYRSVIFYHNESQCAAAEKSKKETDAAHVWPDPMVTEISAFKNFFKAEDYHQNYYNDNQDQPYCRFVIDPKIQKLKKEFKDKLKKN